MVEEVKEEEKVDLPEASEEVKEEEKEEKPKGIIVLFLRFTDNCKAGSALNSFDLSVISKINFLVKLYSFEMISKMPAKASLFSLPPKLII